MQKKQFENRTNKQNRFRPASRTNKQNRFKIKMGLKMKSSWNTKQEQDAKSFAQRYAEHGKQKRTDRGTKNCKNRPSNSFVDAVCNTKTRFQKMCGGMIRPC